MNKLRIAVLFSGGASALQYLRERDSAYGRDYQIVCGVSNKKETKGEAFCRENAIPFWECNTKAFCRKHQYHGKLRDMPSDIRSGYFKGLVENILLPYKPDMILLSGFMLEITKPLLGYWPIINVHPADLRIKGENGKPKYTGDDAVTLAMEAGERTTASTIHLVEREVDCGKILCVSDPLEIAEGMTPGGHQQLMKIACDGPAYQEALRRITHGEFVF